MIKYIGEMYNYRVVDSIIIFRTLYLLITYGVNLDSKYFKIVFLNKIF
jgi:regulator of nonsense transcripts 2